MAIASLNMPCGSLAVPHGEAVSEGFRGSSCLAPAAMPVVPDRHRGAGMRVLHRNDTGKHWTSSCRAS